MKKTMKFLAVVLSFFTISSCSNSDEQFETKDDTISQNVLFNQLKEISLYHSKGLDACFNTFNSQLIDLKKPDFSRKNINKLSIKFAKQQIPVFLHTTRIATVGDQDILADTIVRPLSSEAEKMYSDYMNTLLHSESAESMELYIRNLIQTEDFLSLDSEEQPYFIFMMLIGIDSAQYWSNPENMEKWKNLKNNSPTTSTRGVAGPPASYWMTSEQIEDPTFQEILQADIRGCGWSLLAGFNAVGWAIGGISGSIDSALF